MIESANYYIIDLIGSLPDESRNSNKIDNYYQPTNGILIRNFAINFYGIKPKNIKILAYGNEQDYSIYNHTNNKCFYQIDLDNLFQIDINPAQINFDYFDIFNEALKKIEDFIPDSKNHETILLFLDNHGFKGYFSQTAYFQLYEIIMKFQDNYFIKLRNS